MRLVGVVLVMLGIGQAAPAAQRSMSSPYVSPDGVFRVVFPCTPEPQPLPAAAVTGVAPRLMLDCTATDLFAGVTESQAAAVGDSTLDDTRNELVARMNGKVLSEEFISVSGYPGRVVRMAGPKDTLLAVRLIVLPESRRLYQITTVMRRDQPEEPRANAFLESFAILKAPVPEVSRSDLRSAAFLLAAAGEANKSLPLRIDKETELMNAGAMEGLFIYNNRLVNLTADQLDAGKMNAMLKPPVTNAACTNATLRDLIAAGVTIRYTYSDRDRRLVTQFDVTPADCAAAGLAR